MKLPAPFRTEGEHIAIELDGARVLFTTRRGGHSRGPFASLNLGILTDDDPAAVRANRRELADGLDVAFVHGRQVHGATVTTAFAAPDPDRDLRTVPEADGQATSVPGLAPLVLTADCLAIAIAGPGAVAMVHAGWRGLADGVIAGGAAAVRALTRDDALLQAAIGPGAGPCCYEVGEEVHAHFAEHGASARRGRNLDLKAIAAALLAREGITTVHDVGLCTICSDPGLFFSHRRDRGVTGRQAGIAWLS
jgi:YfiH family protein